MHTKSTQIPIKENILSLLSRITDPEIPVLTIADLGILREVIIHGDEIEVVITPTYSGCPAMDMIAANIRMALMENGYQNFRVTSVLSPVWTTDWMSEEGKKKLEEYGIAAPRSNKPGQLIPCPQCHSIHTRLISEFGSTACKALYQCIDCREPFDYFKCH